METNKLLKDLCTAVGLPGQEHSAAKVAQQYLDKLGRCETSPLGSLICTVTEPRENGVHIMLDAHIDEIGLIVTAVTEDGFIKVGALGGVDRRILSAAQLTIHADKPLKAIVCSVPPHLQDSANKDKLQKLDEFSVDVGLSREKAEELIKPGMRVSWDIGFNEMLNSLVSGRALDDRAGCAVVMKAAELIKKSGCEAGLTVVLSSMEEVGGMGAKTAAYSVRPTHAIEVDVSFAHVDGVPKYRTSPLGGGPMIGFAPILSDEMSRGLVKVAENEKIPYSVEVMGRRTGTNADDIAVAGAGVKVAMVSVPQRNMHSPAEIVSLNDIEATAKLIAEYIKSAF